MPKLMIDTDDLAEVELELHTTSNDIILFFRIVAALQEKLARRERANGTLRPLADEAARRLTSRAKNKQPVRDSQTVGIHPEQSESLPETHETDIDLTLED